MPSIKQIVAAERSRIIFTIVGENQFKRDFLTDWEEAAGSSGNIVNGKFRMDNGADCGGYRGYCGKDVGVSNLLFNTFGMDYDEIDDIDRAKGVRQMYIGLKTDWEYERTDQGKKISGSCDMWGNNCTTGPIAIASINGDKQTFKDVLTSVNGIYDDVSEIVINSTRTATASNEDYDIALADAKALSVPQPNGRAEGIESITCASGVPISTSDGTLVIDSMNNYTHLNDLSATVSAVYEYQASHTTKVVWRGMDRVTMYDVTVRTLYMETRTYPPNIKLFEPDGYYLEIANNWTTVTGIDPCGSTFEGECYPVNILEHQAIYTRVVFYLESRVDWLVRHGDYYDIDKVKFLKADPKEIMSVINLAINMWVNVDKGFWGSWFGRFLKIVIFVAAAIAIMFVIMWMAIVGSTLGNILGPLLMYGISYGAAAITQDAMMFEALMMATVIYSIGINFALNGLPTLDFTSDAFLTRNNISGLESMYNFIEPYMYGGMSDMTLPEETYKENMDTEEIQTALMYGDMTEDLIYYNYDNDIAFKDIYSDYATMT